MTKGTVTALIPSPTQCTCTTHTSAHNLLVCRQQTIYPTPLSKACFLPTGSHARVGGHGSQQARGQVQGALSCRPAPRASQATGCQGGGGRGAAHSPAPSGCPPPPRPLDSPEAATLTCCSWDPLLPRLLEPLEALPWTGCTDTGPTGGYYLAVGGEDA